MAGGEFEFIRERLRPLTRGDAAALDLQDDAALLTETGPIVLASDMLVEDRHFLRSDGPAVAARRAFGSNLSDLAAMGATPRGYLLSVAWPSHYGETERGAFVDALAACSDAAALPLLGGDTTTGAPVLVVSMTMIGRAPPQALTRSGARTGDDVWVSGSIGDAVLGLSIARGELDKQDFLLSRYQCPEARIVLGQRLAGLATSCVDISDGLVAEAGHLAEASGRAIEIETTLIPWSAPVLHWLESEGQAGVETLITGGDDYELLFTAPPGRASEILALKSELGEDLTWIGRVGEGQGVSVLDEAGQPMDLDSGGFTHF